MKKIITLVLALTMAVSLFTGCGKRTPRERETDSDKLSVVTTIFPEYDWVILGDKAHRGGMTCTAISDIIGRRVR